VLITRDRHLASIVPEGLRVVLAREDGTESVARSLGRDLPVDWQRAPFTRCLLENALLVPAEPSQLAAVPPASRPAGGPVRSCPVCGRVYWQGGHVRRMQARLRLWQTDGQHLEGKSPDAQVGHEAVAGEGGGAEPALQAGGMRRPAPRRRL
jgi:uncharacterized protein